MMLESRYAFERAIALYVTGKMSSQFLPTAAAMLMSNYVLSVSQAWSREARRAHYALTLGDNIAEW